MEVDGPTVSDRVTSARSHSHCPSRAASRRWRRGDAWRNLPLGVQIVVALREDLVLRVAAAERRGALAATLNRTGEPLMLELNIPEVIAEVTEAFTRYERALVANDVAALDMLFWNSTHTLRFGIGENLYGYEAIAAFRNARPPINLKRQLQNTLIVSYGRDLATANTEFRRDGSRSIGRQSHVWLRTEAGWRIAAAHVSLMPASGSDAAGRKAEASAQTGSERG